MLRLLFMAVAILIALLLTAFSVSRLFPGRRTVKRVLMGVIALYVLACSAYFGFIGMVLSGGLN